jgi:XTP/dITP diphosphohydrolase
MNAPTLVLASRNGKKIAEMRELLEPHGVDVRGVGDSEDVPEVVEDGTTFGENAAKKASQTALHLGSWTLGEDSGLEVDALNGAPGVYSARYGGPDATDESNNRKLLAELDGVPEDQRGARYVCHVCVSDPEGTIRLDLEATCRGRIAAVPRGDNGFGYDPLFTILELHKTFGELSPAVKRQLSHRARAFQRLVPKLVALLK